VLDISAHTFPNNTITNDTTKHLFPSLAVVGIILPSSLTTINASFYNTSTVTGGLESITIPAGVTSIAQNNFFYCGNLRRVTFEGNNTTIKSQSFPGAFASYYNSQTTKAGTYIGTPIGDTGMTWSKE
jgi:hypothetical protein